MNRSLVISIVLMVAAGLALWGMLMQDHSSSSVTANGNLQKEEQKVAFFKQAPKAGDPGIPDGNHVKIGTDKGDILIELYPDEAPDTVANFKALAGGGFYDGLTFHRIIPNFVAQGGDPNGNGTGGPGYHIKAEFNSRKHVRGSVAMARTADPDSAGSQFYICYEPQPHLDGQYTVFGQVIKGMDVVDRITVGTVMKKVSVLP